jgi:enoyl-[acyl-carrier protein] reductase I
MADLMKGKRVLVTGARNKWSIAWHSAVSLHREGASLAFSVYGEREEKGVAKLLEEHSIQAPIFQCDAGEPEQVDALFEKVGQHWGGQLDGFLHAMAFAKREELSGEYADTTKEGFSLAHESSVYTLIALARAARPLMTAAGGGSITTLTYIGAERVVPNYNIMGVAKASLEASVRYLAMDMGKDGIRVNAVSAGPIKTLAASGISGFDEMLKRVGEISPLKRTITGEDVGDTVLFLHSDLSRGITGEVIYVDGGYHIVGMI